MTYQHEYDDCGDCGDCGDCSDCNELELEDESWKGRKISGDFEVFEEYLRSKGFIYLSEGSFRRVYERKGIVIKVPTFEDGLLDNRVEHTAYHMYWNGPTRRGVYLAPCRLLMNGCLMMKKLTWDTVITRPKWVELIDGQQVGIYKERIVAYDYALDMTERFNWEREWKCESKFFNSLEWRDQRPHINSYLSQKERRQRKAG